MIALGAHVCDDVTGFEGTATGRAEYLDGSVKVLVEARHATDVKERWISEHRLSTVNEPPSTGFGP